MSCDMEETMQRLQKQKGVEGVIILDWEGRAIRSSFDEVNTALYATHVLPLAEKARSTVWELDSNNEMQFLRLRCRRNELMIAPEKEYLLIVVQIPQS